MARAKRAELGAELAQSLMAGTPQQVSSGTASLTAGNPVDISVKANPEIPSPAVDFESSYPAELPGLDSPSLDEPFDVTEVTSGLSPTPRMDPPQDPEPRVNPGSLAGRTPRFGHVVAGEIRPDFKRIVETLFASDAFATYEDLERNLEVGEERANRRTLQEHLDRAEARARSAHRLYASAKLELVAWEVDDRRTMAALREKARLALEQEKDKGDRKKTHTIQDMEDWIAENYFDEWKARQVTRAAIKEAVESLEHLVKRWDSKCVDLRVLLETLR